MNHHLNPKLKKYAILLLVLLLAGCSWFGRGQNAQNNTDQAGTQQADSIEPLGPLPPAVVETSPLPGSEIAGSAPITFYFNQPMDQASVQGALTVGPVQQGVFEWTDPATVVYKPAAAWPLGQTVEFTLAETASASNGLAMQSAEVFSFKSSQGLQLAQMLPEPDTFEVDPTSAVVAAFNSPVVPLGAELAAQPPAFSISPDAPGRGEWLNTSTYIFYPEPGLTGGQLYTVRLTDNLSSTQGVALNGQAEWSFMTAVPTVVSVLPVDGASYIPLDQSFVLKFNQPMDTTSVEQHLSLIDYGDTSYPGEFEWDQSLTQVAFTPEDLLPRNRGFFLILDGEAQGVGGTPLGETQTYEYLSVGDFTVLNTRPQNGGQMSNYGSVQIQFYSRIQEGDLSDYISLSPNVSSDYYTDGTRLNISAAFEPGTRYTLTISGDLEDAWGSSLGGDVRLTFSTDDLAPGIQVPEYLGAGTLLVDPEQPNVTVQARSVSQAQIQVGAISFDEFIFLKDYRNYEARQSFYPTSYQEYSQTLNVGQNQNRVVNLSLSGGSGDLPPGIYWLNVEPDTSSGRSTDAFIVSTYVNLLTKVSGVEVFVWAVDRRTGAPVSGHSVSMIDQNGISLASGTTDENGVFQASVPQQDEYRPEYIIMDSPGDEFFSVAPLDWTIDGWYQQPHNEVYLYTDRPIYKPGDTVNFRGVLRQAYYGQYQIPGFTTLSIEVSGYPSGDITTLDVTVSEFGTITGSFTLPTATIPGDYSIQVLNDINSSTSFQVAEYRKPEIDLQIDIVQDELLAGQTLDGLLDARYFFEAPVSNLDFTWSLDSTPSYFSISGYSVGPINSSWFDPSAYFWWDSIDNGEGRTNPQGQDQISAETRSAEHTQNYTLSVSMTDESGFPISAADTVTVHPAPFYIGVKSDLWVGRVNERLGFQGIVVDWDKTPVGSQTVTAILQSVKWTRQRNIFQQYEYIPEFTHVGSTEVTSSADGTFAVEFIPPSTGVYMLEVTGGGALTQTLVWVGGVGDSIWPARDNGEITLVADKESYQPGDIAQVFIPNPFGIGAQALVTLERGQVLRSQRITFEDASFTFPLELTKEYAPNVYLTVTILGEENGRMGYRYGSINLPVDPAANLLNVEVLGEPTTIAPGQTSALTLRVTDTDGNPVRGEFSIAVVDEAIFALADPNARPIEEYFYDEQFIGVRTGISLFASATRFEEFIGGMGGGGGDGDILSSYLRSEFKDTAFWNGTVVTDSNGTAQVQVTMPDNLTTWRVTAVGLTADTKVGQGQSELITTKHLLIRPATPRFFVAGDHAQIAAVVHNTSGSDISVAVNVLFEGFTPDNPADAMQTVNVPANGRTRLEWWGTVQDIEAVNLTFSAEGGGLQDLMTPSAGGIPVLRYSSPQTFATAGVIDEGSERIEVISLPRTFDPTSGGLEVQLLPSLAGGILESLDALDENPYETTEYTVSRLFANLETYLALQSFGVSDPDLQNRLDDAVKGGIAKLLTSNNFDGGWSWTPTSEYENKESDPFVTAYVVLSLTRAQEAGFEVTEWKMDEAVRYLTAYLSENQTNWVHPWEFDRAVFIQYVLAHTSTPYTEPAFYLYNQRAQLNPWSQALLGLTWQTISPGDEQAQTLFSDLQAKAIRSATGVHWQDANDSTQNMSTAITNTSIVAYALSQYDPASTLLPDAARYLMAHRDVFGMWTSPYATAWSVLALDQIMRSTGELSSEYAFSSSLNTALLTEGQAGGGNLAAVSSYTDIGALFPQEPNRLTIRRDPGTGRLYYSAFLQLYQPVSQAAPVNRGITVSRLYYPADADCTAETCTPVQSIPAGDLVRTKVVITLPYDMYYLTVEDYIPAGTEIINRSLKAYQYLEPDTSPYNPHTPFDGGWGWWWFDDPAIYNDHITWLAEYLPAGTYELEYTLITIQPGEFQIIPARAYQLYFPEVQGASAGEVFSITP